MCVNSPHHPPYLFFFSLLGGLGSLVGAGIDDGGVVIDGCSDVSARQQQVQRVADACSMTVLNIGALAKLEMDRATKWGVRARSHHAVGAAVPSHMAAWLLLSNIATRPNREGFIIDGYPASLEDAEALNALGVDYEMVVALTDAGDEPPLRNVFGALRVEHFEEVDGAQDPDSVFAALIDIASEYGASMASGSGSGPPNGGATANDHLSLLIDTLEDNMNEIDSTIVCLNEGALAGEIHRLSRNAEEVSATLAKLVPDGGGVAAADALIATPWTGPKAIGACIHYLYTRGLEEGLFRVPGAKTTVDAYHTAFEANRVVDLTKELDPAAVASLLKLEMKHHHFPLDTAMTRSLAEDDTVDLGVVASALATMDPTRATGLRKLVALFGKVIDTPAVTKMTASGLAIAIGPTVFPGVSQNVYKALLGCLLTDAAWALVE
jgi:hypothetical protein